MTPSGPDTCHTCQLHLSACLSLVSVSCATAHPQDTLIVANDSLITGKQRHYCNLAVNDLLVTKPSKCNDLQGQQQGPGNKAKDLTFKAKAKNMSFKAKDLKIVIKDSLRPRTPITDTMMLHDFVSTYCIHCITMHE